LKQQQKNCFYANVIHNDVTAELDCHKRFNKNLQTTMTDSSR